MALKASNILKVILGLNYDVLKFRKECVTKAVSLQDAESVEQVMDQQNCRYDVDLVGKVVSKLSKSTQRAGKKCKFEEHTRRMVAAHLSGLLEKVDKVNVLRLQHKVEHESIFSQAQ